MCEVRKLGTIRNERITGTTKVVKISAKVQEMLKWHGHAVKRRKYMNNDNQREGEEKEWKMEAGQLQDAGKLAQVRAP